MFHRGARSSPAWRCRRKATSLGSVSRGRQSKSGQYLRLLRLIVAAADQAGLVELPEAGEALGGAVAIGVIDGDVAHGDVRLAVLERVGDQGEDRLQLGGRTR